MALSIETPQQEQVLPTPFQDETFSIEAAENSCSNQDIRRKVNVEKDKLKGKRVFDLADERQFLCSGGEGDSAQGEAFNTKNKLRRKAAEENLRPGS